MARQSSSDAGYGSRIRASLAVTVAVFALSISYWGIYARQQSQADTIGTTTINFDDKAAGDISGSAYPDILITSNGQSRGALYQLNNPNCPGFAYPSSPNALYIPSDTAGGNSILNIAFTGGRVSNTVSLQLVHYTTTVNIKVEALDSSGAVIDTKMTNPPGGNGCANTPFTFTSGTGTGIASIRMAAVQPEASSSWGVDDFTYSTLHQPISNFDFSLSTSGGPAPLTVTATYTGTQASGLQLNWDFGDGQTMQNGPTSVSHTYSTSGTYQIKLTAGSFNAQKTITVSTPTPPPPTPLSFSISPLAGPAPLTVTGTGIALQSGRTITWNWGDSSTPEQQTKDSLSHTYAKEGSYLVAVTQVDVVSGQQPTTQTAQKTVVVSATTPPPTAQDAAALSTTKSTYDIGEVVHFTLTNTGSTTLSLANTAPFTVASNGTAIFSPIGGQVVTQLAPTKTQSWTWDQKTTSGTQVAEGVYAVTVSYGAGAETKTKTATFTIAKQGIASTPTFTYKIDPTSGNAPLTVKATVTGTPDGASLLWDFGDGTTGTGASLSHTYATTGTYNTTIRIGSQVGTQQVVVTAASSAPLLNTSNGSSSASTTKAPTRKLAQTGISLGLTLLIAFVISGMFSYLIIRRPFHA